MASVEGPSRGNLLYRKEVLLSWDRLSEPLFEVAFLFVCFVFESQKCMNSDCKPERRPAPCYKSSGEFPLTFLPSAKPSINRAFSYSSLQLGPSLMWAVLLNSLPWWVLGFVFCPLCPCSRQGGRLQSPSHSGGPLPASMLSSPSAFLALLWLGPTGTVLLCFK